MKKLFFVLFTFFVFATPAFAQVEPDPDPTNWIEILQSFGALVLAIPLIVDFFKTKLRMEGLPLQILSWGVGIVISFIAWWLNMGIFAGLLWWQTLAVGIGVSLASNGIADTGLIRTILSLFGINVNKHKTV